LWLKLKQSLDRIYQHALTAVGWDDNRQ
jgi:hypothetical protein